MDVDIGLREAWRVLRRKPDPRAGLGIFAKKGVFLNNPRGGVEDVAEMKAAGFEVLYLNVGDFRPSEWDVIRYRARALGVQVLPWARVRKTDDVILLCGVGHLWESPTIVVNLENEAETVLPPKLVRQLLDRYWGLARTAVGISTVCWLYNSVDWTPFSRDVFMLQYFPAEVPHLRGQLDACFQHARDLGVRFVCATYGTYWAASPRWYDLKAPHSLFIGDTIGPGNWSKWR